ncbi:MAG TPA: hypothetical protein VE129_04825, partial [Thermoanaerobaculia bacterium]|nr:hypothetical protein [Thermoanaerobaculia bacterium]
WLATLLMEGEIQDLILVRTSTGETRRLTDDALREDDFAWATDGETIYFTVAPEGKSEVWSIRPDGSGRERCVNAPGNTDLFAPLPSPDGRWLYVEVGLKNPTPSLVDLGVPPAERRPAPLPPMSGKQPFGARDWSADGRWLLGYPHDEAAEGEVKPVLTLFDVELRTYHTLADLGTENGCAFLPDSRRILLWTKKGELRLLDRETGAFTPAGSIEGDFQRRWLSRDGHTLVGGTVTRQSDIWMLDDGP